MDYPPNLKKIKHKYENGNPWACLALVNCPTDDLCIFIWIGLFCLQISTPQKKFQSFPKISLKSETIRTDWPFADWLQAQSTMKLSVSIDWHVSLHIVSVQSTSGTLGDNWR